MEICRVIGLGYFSNDKATLTLKVRHKRVSVVYGSRPNSKGFPFHFRLPLKKRPPLIVLLELGWLLVSRKWKLVSTLRASRHHSTF